jgi:NAD(P)-dependent dehydrogenase (short-subunit alcohol dehydrogenase family)
MNTTIALITGGSRGLGRDMAKRLAEQGHDVIITYQSRQQEAEQFVQETTRLGRKAAALRLDVSDVSSMEGFIEQLKAVLKEKWNSGQLDFLVNNAGVGATIPFEQATEADFDRFSNIHFKSVFFLTQKIVKLMNHGGRIINISSGSVRVSVPGYSIYASMKGAIETLTRYLAKELGSKGITVNVVAPGAIETDFNNAAIRNNPERRATISAMSPLGRVGQPDDIGGVVAFLCSPDARWINGQRIEVSGGMGL